jgi:tetratricopeptide (TPR) repeat protein
MMLCSVILVISLTHRVTITSLLLCGLLLLADLLYYLRLQHPLVYYSLIIGLLPMWTMAYYQRANAYWNRKEYQRAIADYDRTIQRRPYYAEAYVDRGLVYYELGAYQQCLSDCKHALELDATLVKAYIGQGLAYHSLQEYQRAIQQYNDAIAFDATDPWPYGNRAAAYYELKAYRNAIQDCDTALAHDPNYIYAYCYRGLAYSRLETYQQALDDCTQAIKKDPACAYAYTCRGQVYLRLGDLRQAIAAFSKGWELDPETINNAWMMEWAKMCLDRPDVHLADRLEAIAARNPTHRYAALCRAVAQWLRGDSQEALAEMQQAPGSASENELFSFWQGMITLSLGREQEALAAFKCALNLAPALLTPLHWLQQDSPDLYARVIIPLLAS